MSGGMEEAAYEEALKESQQKKKHNFNGYQEKDLWELHKDLLNAAAVIKNLLENRK